jgi:VCBS repeat-containing protein
VVAASGVLANDSDPNNDPLTAIKVTNPSHGTVTFNANGSFTYMPAANYSGVDSFTYKANDGALDSNVATVTITVISPCRSDDDDRAERSKKHRAGDGDDHDRGINGHHDGDGCEHDRDAHSGDRDESQKFDWDGCKPGTPNSHHDEYEMKKNQVLTVAPKGVLKNDGSLAATAETYVNPLHGTLALAPGGGFVYTPALNFVGKDVFFYVPRSAAGVAGAVTSVTIQVAPAEDGKDKEKDKDKK